MKYIIIFLSFALLFGISCGQHGKHKHGERHGSANQYMHQSSTDRLIKRFDSEERTAYQQPEKVMDYIGELADKKIMDLGAGSGYFSFRLAARGAKVIAADVEDGFQDHIKKRIEEEGLDSLGIELRKIPYDSPSLAPGEVDIVLVVNTYHHIEDRVDYFLKVLAGLAEGGELIIVDYFKKKQKVGPPEGHKLAMDVVVKELKAAGFTEIETNTELLEYQYIVRAR